MRGIFKRKKQKLPEMPSFPADYEDVMKAMAPYYLQERPMDFFFEMFIVDVLELLPDETLLALDDFSNRFPDFFKDYDGDWKRYVKGQLNLSNTIEIAIWDLWIRNSKIVQEQGSSYHPWHFAINFSNEFFAKGSKVDVWQGNALELAKKGIEEYKSSS
jgi:hypothetical protein